MTDIGVGDYVQCVDAAPCLDGYWRVFDDGSGRLKEGGIYLVLETCNIGIPGIRIRVPSNHPTGQWRLSRFRKIGPGERSDLDVRKPEKVTA
ncbi:MAG: hypothetical protein KA105_02690 [Caulobacter sp.]|nr:hypothetical protein [Caulobacter sp.]